MKVLIVEHSVHFKVLANLYHLIKNNCKCELTFYANEGSNDAGIKSALFPEYKTVKWESNPLHRIFFYLWLIVIGWKYNIINISTGPEGSGWKIFPHVLFFYFVCKLYGKKIVLTIKNTRDYLSSSDDVLSFIRSKSISNVERFTFETNTLRDVFNKETDYKINKIGVSYDRYTDLNMMSRSGAQRSNYIKKKYIIGMLGSIDKVRRNYSDIINALKLLPENKRNDFLFVTLGNTPGGYKNEIINEMKRWTNIDCTDGWLTAEELESRGLSCDLLISPLTECFEYGVYKGSGSFGDALLLRKKIIIPSCVDPMHEFENISIYYDSDIVLSNIFNNIGDHIDKKIDDGFYDKFTTKYVYKKLFNDLELNEFCDKGRLEKPPLPPVSG